ncbi:MAG: NADP-dependent oxidoreductase [Alphaproteobacteria bacterium HGW-Alphaproteobacteria-18]|nr:MAG: NADP-dependent oxidoreductase [Alphaproteobacteria bacterium HGW-Alphaproteobacteria-18]
MSQLQQIVLAQYCDGPPKPSDFRLETLPLPEPKDGQFRVAHVWCSVDPGTRSRLSGGDSYAAALPLGRPIDGFSVGIIDASSNPDWPVGTKVFCAGGWKTHSIQSGKGFIGKVMDVPGVPLSAWIGVLGVPGLTAWFGVKDVARFKEGDAVLVTSAAGPVGATAGQLAKAWGASKVVGVAGSDEKCRWLVSEAGFDAAINYKTAADLSGAIAAEFPKGVDVLFDNVGNAMVDTVLPLMALNGRICISGQVADYNLKPEDTPGIVHTKPFITHRVNMQGLVVFDFARAFPEALGSMAKMIASSALKIQEDRFEGIAAMPEAFCGLFRGENTGRRVVKVGAE